jgi:Fe-S-cluster containining protein
LRSRLTIIDEEVAARVLSIEADREWLCRRGCDTCCRSLAAPLLISAEEYSRLKAALDSLSENIQAEIRARIANIPREARPYICPFLERSRGECTVYLARPVACRSFGFYAGREGGRWCGELEAQVSSGAAEDVIFGNHDVLESRLARELGPTKTISEWFA